MALLKTIRDYFGRPVPTVPDAEQLTRRNVVHSTADRTDLTGVLSDVSPGKLKAIFTAADNGDLAQQIELAQTIRERDEHVGSVDQTRRLAVAQMEFVIQPGDSSDPASKQAADAFAAEWEALEPQSIIDRMMCAVLDQWHVERVIWETDGVLGGKRHWRPAAIEEEDARRLQVPSTASPSTDPAIAGMCPEIAVDASMTRTEPLTAGQYLIHSVGAVRGRPGRGALIRSIAVLWMFKKFSLNDVVSLIEKWGRPWPAIKYKDGATVEEIGKWLDTLVTSMADRAIAIPIGSELEISDAKASGADTPHFNLMRYCNEGISKRIVGSTTISDAAANNDSVSSPTHAGVREDIRNADAQAVAGSIFRSLCVPWTVWNYGPAVAPPRPVPITETSPEPESRGRVFLQARDLSLKVKSEQVYRDLGLEMPEGVPDTLSLSLPQLAGLGSGFAGWMPGNAASEDVRPNLLNKPADAGAES